MISAAGSFPSGVVNDSYFARSWMVESEGDLSFEFLNEVVVHKELAARTNVDGTRGHRENREEEEAENGFHDKKHGE
jgi:hypothetical protein